MADHETVESELRELRSLVGKCSPEDTDFKAAWAQIKRVGGAFKGTRFPSRQRHDAAWEEFQALVAEVKRRQEITRAAWERRKRESERLKDRIVAIADSIRLSTGLEDAVLAAMTGGLSVVLDMLLGPLDDRKAELKQLGETLRRGWNLLAESKAAMLGRDKQAAFHALNEAKARLDRGWAAYKQEIQRAQAVRQRQHEERQSAWRERVVSNIRSLEERRDKLTGVLAHKERHLEELFEKRSDARSDDFRERVSGWIEEERASIVHIRRKLDQIEEWLRESRAKLR